MKSYKLTEAAEYIISGPEDFELTEEELRKSKYTRMIELFEDCGLIYRGTLSSGYGKTNKWILSEEFKHYYPEEANEFFEEKIVKNKFYQLKITERGIEELGKFIVRESGKGLF